MFGWCKCVVVSLAAVLLIGTGSARSAAVQPVPATQAQKCVPPGPGLSLNDFLSGKFYLFERQQAFSIKLLQTAVAASPKQNLIFSPHSIYTAVLIAYFLSGNRTEESLKGFLNLPADQSKLSVMQAYRMEKLFHSMRAVNTSSDYEFSSVDRLFVSQRLPLQKCVADVFKNEVHKMDFVVDPELARLYINNWVANQTNGHIKDLVPSSQISYNTRLVLANAAYFKGLWSSKFSSESTKEEVFYTSPTENAYVPMMWQSGMFNLLSSDELGAHVLELPYKGGDVSLFIILPPFNKQRGISLLTKRLNTDILQDIVSSGEWRSRSVEVSLPKFSVEQTMSNLVPILEQMGIGDLFKSTADLSALTGSPNGVTMDEAVHKAKISVDEEGTIAAAATAFISSRSSRPAEPFKFRCNHPFVYFLFDKITGAVLFMGVYNSPKSN